ncbi:shikimate dehydrogenase [Arthrobacter gandavensis]|uniref:shikimate dehydrogenase n=1 Tax=Arthrobacter gandavensis TaxID=169960 RepID=UPI00188DD289|nr:shikimate dehydrogenase [Arthrobacter gandavensis]MBF4995282.1 shikimate dehydrogenase [Arthrobacter gandavensis]
MSVRKRAAVLGHPIGHSRSPQLHRAAYDFLGFDCSYDAIDVTEEAAADFAAALRTQPEWIGLSVTMPLKAVMAAAIDRLDPLAEALGVLNTVTFGHGPEGTVLTGWNTDVTGLVNALRHAGAAEAPRGVILGAGGTACAAVAALARMGCTTVDVHARSFRGSAGAGGQADVQQVGARLGVKVDLWPWDDAAAACAVADVVLCTLPPRGADALAEQLRALGAARAGAVLLDAAYDPWPSRLAAAWESAGGTIVPGLEMLLYQAVEQVRLFTGSMFRDEASVINVMCDAVGLPRR